MKNDACPHCGAKVLAATTFGTLFFCDSSLDSRGYLDQQSRRCLESQREHMADELAELRNQLAAVTAERDDLQQRIDASPVAWILYCWNGSMTIHKDAPPCSQGFPERARVRLVTDDQPGA